MNWDEYREAQRKAKQENYQRSQEVFEKAQELAEANGLELLKHSHWHFALIYRINGHTKWLYNIYPSNQRIWNDPKYRAPFLQLEKPWTLLGVVEQVIMKTRTEENILNEIEKSR